MLTKNQKILAAALTTALLGGTVGAFIAHKKAEMNQSVATESANSQPVNDAQPANGNATNGDTTATANRTATEQTLAPNGQTINAYRNGYEEGYQAGRERNAVASTRVNEAQESPRVVTRTRTRYAETPRYYEQRRPSWAQRHRDILTVAGGAGAGALVGGLIGGRKGAGIGLLSGGGLGALYTYKLRHKHPRY